METIVESKYIRLLKEIIKEFVSNHIIIHNPGPKKDIVILSSPRSGSTWLMEIISAEDKIRYINEPFNRYLLDINDFFPIPARCNYFYLSGKEKGKLKKYLYSNKINHFGPSNILNPNWPLYSNRRVLKVIRANALIEWFAQELEMDVIFLIRHPIPQLLSCMMRGHYPFCKETIYCENEHYIKEINKLRDHFSQYQLKFIKDIIYNGNDFEKFTLEWCLDNYIPLKVYQSNNNFILLTYEELLFRTEEVIEYLAKKLELINKEVMINRKNKLSRTTNSSSKKTKRMIKKGNALFLIKKWKKEITIEQEELIFRILNVFDINAYKFGSVCPNDELLKFGPITWE